MLSPEVSHGLDRTGQVLGENVLYNHATNFLNKQFTDATAEFELFLGVSTALDVVSSVKVSAVIVSVRAGASPPTYHDIRE